MIPTREQLEEISGRPDGDLRQTPFAVVLEALALEERTVVLEIRRRQLVKEIVLEYGVPVDCRSNLVHETLGRFMVAQGKLTQEQHDECFRESITRGVRLGEVLREHGLVDSAELFRTLQQNLAKKLLDGFTWSEGEYRLRSEIPRVESPLKVRVPQLIVTGISRFAPQQEVNAGLWPLLGQKLALHPRPPFPLEGVKLSEDQRRLVELLETPREVQAIVEEMERPFEEVTRHVYALAVLGAVAPEEEVAGVVPDEPAEAPPKTRPSPAAGPLGAEEAKRLREEVMEAYLAHRRQDAFDLLEVPEDASVATIRERYLDFAYRYAPWRFQQPELAPMTEEALDLFLAGAQAFAQLMDGEQRNTLLYRRRVLAEEADKKATKPAADLKIETDLLDPATQYEKGLAKLEAGQHREAVDLLEFAADCDPQNGLYRAEAAWARYLLDPKLHGKQALEELAEARRIDPGCGLAAYYNGEILRSEGELDEAERLLRRANQLMAPDRRPIEALKALSRDRKRR